MTGNHERTATTDETGGKIWIGFDLGGTKMLAIAYDEEYNEKGRRRRKTRGREGSDRGVERIGSTIERLLEENDLSEDQIVGIGIGCPGPIDLEQGRVLTAPNLGWDDVGVGAYLRKRFGCHVSVMNDVDAGVYGEYRFGAAREARCVVGLFPGTGVGGGCIYEGKILVGAGLSCMEVGHTKISSSTRRSGFKIPGTLESEASRLTIAAEAAKAAFRGEAPHLMKEEGTDLADIRSGAISGAVKNGDQAIKEIVLEACESLSDGVMNLVHILSPDIVVLGGGLVEAMEDLFVETIESSAKQKVLEPYRDRFKVVAAKLGDDAAAIGAAAWARKQLDLQMNREAS